MKKLFTYLLFAITLIIAGCSESFDDSKIWEELDKHENRIAKLEEQCKQMNANIASLQTIVTALQDNDYITGVTPINQNGQTVGYTITFTKSQPITIYHGKDGQNGKDGYTPQIGVKQDTDGIYYWTVDGVWLYDANGNKIKAVGTDGKDGQNGEDGNDGANGSNGANGQDGEDGITPKLKIENDYWYVSYDNGQTWTKLGKATGEDGKDGTNGAGGKDGDSFFQGVDTSNDEYVIFTLADGTQIQLPTWYAFEQLRTLCNQMNTNISSLQAIVSALQNNDYITACTPLMDEGVQIGYTITFAKSGSIVIYHGKDGKDGENGTNGTNGTDGITPVIGAKYHTDNILYWTINGEWLLDEDGNKVCVHGEDGVDGSDGKDGRDAITPQLKIENNYWYISYDNGASWTQLGKATGEDGEDGQNGTNGADGNDGDSFFQSVTQDEDFIHIVLSTGEKFDIPRHHPLSVTFTETEDIRVLADKTYTIGYTITGADDKTVIKALAQDGFRAVVKKTDNATGVIEITTPSTILPTEVLIFVTDGKERTIMRSINFVEGVIILTSKSYTVDYAGGTVQVPLSSNIDYTIEIPEADKSWISVAETRAVIRDETLTFTVAKNEAQSVRYATVKLVDDLGVVSETILITQKAGIAKSLNVATAGTLENMIGSDEKNLVEELTLTGRLNTFDFDFIKTMSNLKLLDISATSNTTLPASCLTNTKITTVLLPLGLTAIPNRAFYQAAITSIYIPETVQTIGEYAFYQCKSIKGNLTIPDATTSIGSYCFQECTFDGTLTLGSRLKTIGEYAFSQCAKFTGDLIIPNSVTTLGKFVFNKCSKFNGNITIGDSVESIPEYAFYECVSLSGKITIGESVTEIGVRAFAGNTSMSGNLVIPNNVETIREFAFTECVGLTGYLSLGSKITVVGEGAFVCCQGSAKWSGADYKPALGYRSITYTNGTTYYYPTILNFSRVYCSAPTPPKIKECSLEYGYISSNDCYKGLMSLDVNRSGKRVGSFTSAMFYTRAGGSMYNKEPAVYNKLTVKNGCAKTYESDANWTACFLVIEETDF